MRIVWIGGLVIVGALAGVVLLYEAGETERLPPLGKSDKALRISAPSTQPSDAPRFAVANRETRQAADAQDLVALPAVPVNDHYPAERDVTLTFDDGTFIPVKLRSPQVVHPPYAQEGRLIDQYEALAGRARAGDGPAARQLYMELKGCEFIRRSGAKASDSGEPSDTAKRCDGVTEEMMASKNQWVERASKAGDYMARQYWAHELGMTPEAFRVAEAYWLEGNASALPIMSMLAEEGVSSLSGEGPPDYLRAYAYTLIYTKLDLAARAANASWQPAPRLDRYLAYQEYLNRLGGNLTPQQQTAAERMAVQMVNANKNCCTGTF